MDDYTITNTGKIRVRVHSAYSYITEIERRYPDDKYLTDSCKELKQLLEGIVKVTDEMQK